MIFPFRFFTFLLLVFPFLVSAQEQTDSLPAQIDTSKPVAPSPAVVPEEEKQAPASPAQETPDPVIPSSSQTPVEKPSDAIPETTPAADITAIGSIGEIVVSASRWAQKKSEVPNRIVTITSKDIAFQNPQTSADLLGGSGEVFIQKSQLGGGSPMLRGFTANSVLLVIDGVRMNNAIYRAGNLQNVLSIDANTIDNVEVLFGPGSIIYGSDAMGGVFSFHTKSPVLSPDDKPVLSGSAMARISSANMEKTGHVGLNLGLKKFGSYTAITCSGFDDLRIGTGGDYYDFYKRPVFVERINNQDSIVKNDNPELQKPSGYNQFNLLESITLQASHKVSFNNTLCFSTTSDFPRYDRLILYSDSVTLKSAEWYYGPQRWLMNALTFDYSDHLLILDRMKMSMAYQDYEESRHDRNYRRRWLSSRTEKVKGFSGTIDCNKKLDSTLTLLYGAEAVYNDVASTAVQRDIIADTIALLDTRYPDGFNDYGTGSMYGYLTKKWNRLLTTTTGIRYSHIYLHSQIDKNRIFLPYLPADIKINTGALSGALGMVLHPADNWQIDLNVSSGYRAPNVDDMGKIFSLTTGTVRMPNPDLKPEYAYNVELGSEFDIGKTLRFEGAGFFSYVRDIMTVDNSTYNDQDSIMYNAALCQVTSVQNKARAYIWGASASLRLRVTSSISLQNSLSSTRGIEGNDTVPLRPVPPLFGATHILFEHNKAKADFYLCYNGEKLQGTGSGNMVMNDENRAYLYPKEGNLYLCPSWYTLNLKTSYAFSKVISLNIGVENMLNRCYRPYGSGITAAGRNFIASMKSSF